MSTPEDQLLDSLVARKTNRPAQSVFGGVNDWYKQTFGTDIPAKNVGASDFERSAGWEHSRSFDVGLNPNSSQGQQLIKYLNSQGIPFSAFSGAVTKGGRTVATGPHIHVGPPSKSIGSTEATSPDDALLDKLTQQKNPDDDLLDQLTNNKITTNKPVDARGSYMDRTNATRKSSDTGIANIDTTARNIQWHFGPVLARAFPNLTPQQQQQVVQMSTDYAKADEAKRAQGQAITQSPAWQQGNVMRVLGPDAYRQPVMLKARNDVVQAMTAENMQKPAAYTGNLLTDVPKPLRMALEAIFTGGAGIMEAGAGIIHKARFNPLAVGSETAAKGLEQFGGMLSSAVSETQKQKPLPWYERLPTEAAGGILSFAPLMAIPELGAETAFAKIGVEAAKFGLYAGLQSSGRGESVGEQAKATGVGTVTGGLFGVPYKGTTFLSKALQDVVLVGGGTTVVNRVTGQPWGEAATNGLVMTLMKAGPTAYEHLKTYDPNGNLKAVNKAEFEKFQAAVAKQTDASHLLPAGTPRFDLETGTPRASATTPGPKGGEYYNAKPTVTLPAKQTGAVEQVATGEQGDLFGATRPGVEAGREDLPGMNPTPLTLEAYAQSKGMDAADPLTQQFYKEYLDRVKNTAGRPAAAPPQYAQWEREAAEAEDRWNNSERGQAASSNVQKNVADAIKYARENGPTPEFRSFFAGIEPRLAGTTIKAVAAFARKLGIKWEPQDGWLDAEKTAASNATSSTGAGATGPVRAGLGAAPEGAAETQTGTEGEAAKPRVQTKVGGTPQPMQMEFTLPGAPTQGTPIFDSRLEDPKAAMVRLQRLRLDPEIWGQLSPEDRRKIGKSIADLKSGKSPAQILDEAALSSQYPGVVRMSEETARKNLKDWQKQFDELKAKKGKSDADKAVMGQLKRNIDALMKQGVGELGEKPAAAKEKPDTLASRMGLTTRDIMKLTPEQRRLMQREMNQPKPVENVPRETSPRAKEVIKNHLSNPEAGAINLGDIADALNSLRKKFPDLSEIDLKLMMQKKLGELTKEFTQKRDEAFVMKDMDAWKRFNDMRDTTIQRRFELGKQMAPPRVEQAPQKAVETPAETDARQAAHNKANQIAASASRTGTMSPQELMKLQDAGRVTSILKNERSSVDALKQDIQTNGIKAPVILTPVKGSPGQYRIDDGHHRLAAARELGMNVPVRVELRGAETPTVPQGDRYQVVPKGKNFALIDTTTGKAVMTGTYRPTLENEAVQRNGSQSSKTAAPLKLKKGPDWDFDGVYHVDIGGTTYQIFNDTSVGLGKTWMLTEDSPLGTKERGGGESNKNILGYNKADALAELQRRHDAAAAVTPQKVKVVKKAAAKVTPVDDAVINNMSSFQRAELKITPAEEAALDARAKELGMQGGYNFGQLSLDEAYKLLGKAKVEALGRNGQLRIEREASPHVVTYGREPIESTNPISPGEAPTERSQGWNHEKDFERSQRLWDQLKKLHPDLDLEDLRFMAADRRRQEMAPFQDRTDDQLRNIMKSTAKGAEKAGISPEQKAELEAKAAGAFNLLQSRQMDKLTAKNEERQAAYDKKQTDREEARQAKLEATQVPNDLLERAQDDVKGRVQYGKRTETPNKPSYRLVWSNGSAEWHVAYNKIPKGRAISLDANEILVGGSRAQAEAIASKLPPHPLYSLSYEKSPLNPENTKGGGVPIDDIFTHYDRLIQANEAGLGVQDMGDVEQPQRPHALRAADEFVDRGNATEEFRNLLKQELEAEKPASDVQDLGDIDSNPLSLGEDPTERSPGGQSPEELERMVDEWLKKDPNLTDDEIHARLRALPRALVPRDRTGEAGFSTLEAISGGAVKKLNTVRQTINMMVHSRPIRETIAYTRDAGDNAATIFSNQMRNDVRGILTNSFGLRDRSALANWKTGRSLIGEALSFVIESKGDINALTDMWNKIDSSPNAKPGWKKKALEAIDFARDNYIKFGPAVDRYRQITSTQVANENTAGIPTPLRDGYVMHAQDIEGPETGLLGPATGTLSTSFRQARIYDTFADSIAAGVNPKSLDALKLLGERINRGQRAINQRAWLDGLKTTLDPRTGAPIVKSPTTVQRPGLTPYQTAPHGYSLENAGPNDKIAVQNGYEGIYSALTDPSWWTKNAAGRGFMQANAIGKSVSLMVDTFHLGRLAIWESLIRATDGKMPVPTFAKALLTNTPMRGQILLDSTVPEIQRMIASGEVPAEAANDLLARKADIDLLVQTGLNVGGINDAMHQQLLHKLPIAGQFNQWLFNSYQRSAMTEIGLLELARARHAGLPDGEAARTVVKDVNTRFGNLGRQGLIKSASGQDLARGIFLAPQWNEALIRSELGLVRQLGKVPLDFIQGKPVYAGMLLRSVGAMAVGQFVANQLLNFYFRGHSTLSNPEEEWGAKVSAWIPDLIGRAGGHEGPGFFLHPFGLAAETTHLLMKGYEDTGSAYQTSTRYLRSRLSIIGRGVATYLSGRDYLNRIIRPDQVVKEALLESVPTPIPSRAFIQGIRGEEQFPGQFQKQLMSTFGVKTESVPSAEQRIRRLASKFNTEHGVERQGEFYDSAYQPLLQALNRGQGANELKDLLKTKTEKQIRDYFKRRIPAPLTGKADRERAFKDTLNPEQQEQYDKITRGNRRADFGKVTELLGTIGDAP